MQFGRSSNEMEFNPNNRTSIGMVKAFIYNAFLETLVSQLFRENEFTLKVGT